jgi:hypothetical protein
MRATVRDLPIVLLVLAMLLLDVVAFWASRASGDLTASFAISQTCLLGIWIGIGNTRFAIRLPVAVFALGALIRLVCQYPAEATLIDLYLGLTTGWTAFVVGGVRILASIRLITVGESTDASDNSFHWRRFQFTLSQMLQTVVGVSAALAILKFVYPPIDLSSNEVVRGRFVEIGVFVTLGLIATWVMLATKFRIWRLGALVAAAILVAIASNNAVAGIQPDVSTAISPFLAFFVGAMCVCRACGYRAV